MTLSIRDPKHIFRYVRVRFIGLFGWSSKDKCIVVVSKVVHQMFFCTSGPQSKDTINADSPVIIPEPLAVMIATTIAVMVMSPTD